MALLEAEYGSTDLAMNNGRFHGDENLLVKFYMHPKMNEAASKKASRPIFEEAVHIEIMQPGNKDSIIRRPASRMDKERFAEHFRRFEARIDDEGVVGTLLAEWPGITRSQVNELAYLNIKTVEQLASVSDSNAQNVMGISFLKQKANKFLETSKETATAEALAEMQAKYDELLERLSADEPAPKKATKRKPKPKTGADLLGEEITE